MVSISIVVPSIRSTVTATPSLAGVVPPAVSLRHDSIVMNLFEILYPVRFLFTRSVLVFVVMKATCTSSISICLLSVT